MSRTGENIYKRKDGRWEGRYIKGRSPDKTHYGYIYGGSYRDVKQRLTKLKAGQEVRRGFAAPQRGRDETTFSQVAGEWLGRSRGNFKESTLVKYQNMLDCYLLPEFGNTPLAIIDRNMVSDYAERLLRFGGRKKAGLSAKTVSDSLSLLKSIMNYAQDGGMKVNDIALSRTFHRHQKPLRVFHESEYQALCSYLKEHMCLGNLGILFCLFTGIRVGELCALRWGDISFPDKTLHVHQTMQRLSVRGGEGAKTKILISDPKSDCSRRLIPLPKVLTDELDAMRQPPDTFFLTGSPTRFVEPRTMQNRFKAVLKACGIADANFHALRHTFATRCVELGFDLKSLSEILGHASVNITLNRYVHPTLEQKRRNMDKLNQVAGNMGYKPSEEAVRRGKG